MIRELLSIAVLFAGLGILGIGLSYVAGNDDLLAWSELVTAAGCLGVLILFCVEAVIGRS